MTYMDCFFLDCSSWSSTTVMEADSLGVYKKSYVFDNIDVTGRDKSNSHYFRCVRGGRGKVSGVLTGTVKDFLTGNFVSSATVSVIDSRNITHTALTGGTGKYVIADISTGDFNADVSKTGYSSYSFSGTVSAGQNVEHDVQLSPLLGPSISAVATSDITANSATIFWKTDQLSDSLVEYGTTASYGSSVSDAILVTNHSITLRNLIPETNYHFRVQSKNADGLSSSSEDATLVTTNPKFTAKTLGDYGNVIVMEVTGGYDAKNTDGSWNDQPRQEIAKEFIKSHTDDYDFMIIFSNFDFIMPEAEAKAVYLD